MIRRLDPYEHPLVLQNEYLSKIGFYDVYRMQLEGLCADLGYLIRFFSGRALTLPCVLQLSRQVTLEKNAYIIQSRPFQI